MTRPRVAFVVRGVASGFLTVDLEGLRRSFDVDVLRYGRWPTPRFVASALRAAVLDDALYCFFASEHAFVPAVTFAVTGKPLVLAPAGYDFASVPEHRYGLAARHRGWLPRFLARRSRAILACSRAAQAEIVALAPESAAKVELAYLGADPDDWADPGVSRGATVVTLAHGTREAWSRKGLDRFVALAEDDPEHSYVLAGRLTDDVRSLLPSPLPPNLQLPGYLSHEDLRRLMWSSAAYVQLSWHESFGMAVLESMLCGCVPVVSADPALGEVAGSWAVTSLSPEHDRNAVLAAVTSSVDRSAIRRDAAQRFPASARQRAVVEAVARLL